MKNEIITEEKLLKRAVGVLESHMKKEYLALGEMDANLLATAVVSYLGNIPYVDVIKQFSLQDEKLEGDDD